MKYSYEVFGVDRIYVTQAVIDELAKAPFFYDFIRKTEKIERVVVDDVPSHIKSAMLGKGETDSISYALKTKSIFLSNDKKAGEFAEDSGVMVLDIVSFLRKNAITWNLMKTRKNCCCVNDHCNQ
jgi:predicted nucleic acid-binding protein